MCRPVAGRSVSACWVRSVAPSLVMATAPSVPARARPTLFRRLFVLYAAVLVVATLVLVVAPVTVSEPVTQREIAVLVIGLLALLVLYRTLLHRALAPLERLTSLMRTIDPLAPGQRVDDRGA